VTSCNTIFEAAWIFTVSFHYYYYYYYYYLFHIPLDPNTNTSLQPLDMERVRPSATERNKINIVQDQESTMGGETPQYSR
jgi:hypothetical protein